MSLIYARPFDWTENPVHNTRLLDAFVAFPEFMAYPHDPEQARVVGARLLTHPEHIAFGTYNGPEITGVILLTRVSPRMDALLHFLFLDRDLVGKRKLLKNFLGFCFRDLGFQRISMEVPDVKVPNEEGGKTRGLRLERFARRALGFRLEGETRDRPRELPKALDNRWMARQGSRRQNAYFDGTHWHDVICLRLLASEWDGEEEGTECRPQPCLSSHPSPDRSSAAPSAVADPVTPSPSSPKTSSP